jgi:ribosomal protein S18 acetylase RimI-like enzyme
MDIEFFDKKPTELEEFLKTEFEAHNEEQTGNKTKKYYVSIKKGEEMVAASSGGMFKNALYISDFIVKKGLRRSGLGSVLIEKICNHAKNNNCKKVWVDTYGYQAPEFYSKNGFIEKGRIENYRGGYAKIFFEKEL